MSTNQRDLERIPQQYTPAEVFKWVEESTGIGKPKKSMMDGHLINHDSLRYKTFMSSGTKCCMCGVEGTIMYKERMSFNDVYHFNLYAVVDGKYVLMTKDHIVAKKYGGKDHVNNMQTMCTKCNNIKGDMSIDQWQYYVEHGEYREDYAALRGPTKSKAEKIKTKPDKRTYEQVKIKADGYGKQVFQVIMSDTEKRWCIAPDLDNAKSKFPGHEVVPAKPDL